MDLDELNALLSAFHAVINIPGTQNIQRELLKQIREIDAHLEKPEAEPLVKGPQSLPLGPDGSEQQETSSQFHQQQGVRRI